MSENFDTPNIGDPGFDGFDIYEQPTVPSAADNYISLGIIPLDGEHSPADCSERVDTPTANENISDHSPGKESYNPWKLKQIHYIGNTVIEGDHPSPSGNERQQRIRNVLSSGTTTEEPSRLHPI
jgi:hypothetical protein